MKVIKIHSDNRETAIRNATVIVIPHDGKTRVAVYASNDVEMHELTENVPDTALGELLLRSHMMNAFDARMKNRTATDHRRLGVKE